MAVQVSYPGVYIDEQLSGSHTITPVSTSIAAFAGMARRGRLNIPTRVTNLAAFQNLYGGDASMGELVPQVGQFLRNGGSTAWSTRIPAAAGAPDAVRLSNDAGDSVITHAVQAHGGDRNRVSHDV